MADQTGRQVIDPDLDVGRGAPVCRQDLEHRLSVGPWGAYVHAQVHRLMQDTCQIRLNVVSRRAEGGVDPNPLPEQLLGQTGPDGKGGGAVHDPRPPTALFAVVAHRPCRRVAVAGRHKQPGPVSAGQEQEVTHQLHTRQQARRPECQPGRRWPEQPTDVGEELQPASFLIPVRHENGADGRRVGGWPQGSHRQELLARQPQAR